MYNYSSFSKIQINVLTAAHIMAVPPKKYLTIVTGNSIFDDVRGGFRQPMQQEKQNF